MPKQVGSFEHNGITAPLLAGAKNDTFALGQELFVGPDQSVLNGDEFAVHVFEV